MALCRERDHCSDRRLVVTVVEKLSLTKRQLEINADSFDQNIFFSIYFLSHIYFMIMM